MCFWKAQCGIEVQAWKPRSRQKIPRNPSYEFKWEQMQKRHQQLSSSCCTSRGRGAACAEQWNIWHNRNITICRELANNLDMTVYEVSDLLFNLTFQNYGKILNPIGAGWNECRVPLCVVNVGHCYLDIFDLEGNLRYPTEPKSLYKLLRFLQSVVQSDTNSDVLKRKYVESLEVPLETNFKYDERLGHLVDSSLTDYELDIKQKEQDTNDMLVYSHRKNFQLYKGNEDRYKNNLSDEMGRRLGHGSWQLNTLRKILLVDIIKKIQKQDPEKFLLAVSSIMSGKKKKKKKKKNKNPYKDISDYYSQVADEDETKKKSLGDIVAIDISFSPGGQRTSINKSSVVSINSLSTHAMRNSNLNEI